MLFLSQLLEKKIVDSSDTFVGTLKDILVQYEAGVYAPLSFLFVQGRHGKTFYIPYTMVTNVIDRKMSLSHLLEHIEKVKVIPPEDAVFLRRDVLDQQIVDIEGARVVRVNDLNLGVFQIDMSVLAIDVSMRGIVRRLGFDLSWLPLKFIDWRKIQLIKKRFLQLDTVSEKLIKLHPADLAHIIEDLSVKEGGILMRSLDVKTAAHVMEEADVTFQKAFLRYLGPERATPLLERISTDEVVDLLKLFSKKEARQFLTVLSPDKQEMVQDLLKYDDDTAGGLMTTDYLVVRPDWTVEETMSHIKETSHTMRSLFYVYITDEHNILKGIVSVRTLLIADKHVVIGKIMKRISRHATLHVHNKLNKMLKIMTRYNLNTAVVVDTKETLLGIVTIDDILRQLYPSA